MGWGRAGEREREKMRKKGESREGHTNVHTYTYKNICNLYCIILKLLDKISGVRRLGVL